MNRKLWLTVAGAAAAIVITATMDATGHALFSALPLLPLAALFWYLQKLSREEFGVTWGKGYTYVLALAYPAVVLGGLGLVAFLAGAVDAGDMDWGKVLLSAALGSSVGVVMTLITEEGFFRGWLWASLKRADQSDAATLAWTSIAFTVWHVSWATLDSEFKLPPEQVPIYLANVLILGAVWGWLRMLSGSILVPAVCHAVWNAISYPVYGFAEVTGLLGIEQTHIYGPEVGWLGLLVNSIVAGLCFYTLIWNKK